MSRVNHRKDFPLPLDDVWLVFLNLLKVLEDSYSAQIRALVLMSNHYHMLVRTPLLNIDLIMKHLNREVTRAISKKTGLINHIFGARYRWSIAYTKRDIGYVLRYIFRNPIKAGIVSRAEDYAFSTISHLWVPERFPYLRTIEGMQGLSGGEMLEKALFWINAPIKREEEELIRKASRRKEFRFTTDKQQQHLVNSLSPPPW